MNNNYLDILYHYTNEESLKSILSSQTLWSTHYQRMNDGKELRHFPEYLLKRLDEKSNKKFSKRKIKKLIKSSDIVLHNFLDGVEESVPPEIYVTCFCLDGNSKQLRNKYGNYSIGFDKQELDNLLQMEREVFGFDMSIFEPVVYDRGKIPKKFEDEVDGIINGFNDYVRDKINDCKRSHEKYLIYVSLFKSNEWIDEHEYRLVIGKLSSKNQQSTTINKTPKYRGDDQSIPYIELFDNPNTLLPIREIIIGPLVDYETKKKSIMMLLKEKGLDNTIKISKSIL
jgi:hypothetical protein